MSCNFLYNLSIHSKYEVVSGGKYKEGPQIVENEDAHGHSTHI